MPLLHRPYKPHVRIEIKKETTLRSEPETLQEFCKICGNIAWGNVVLLGFSKWRHEECDIGSEPETLETIFEIPAKLGCNLAAILKRKEVADYVNSGLYYGYTITIVHIVK